MAKSDSRARDKAERRHSECKLRVENQTEVSVHDSEGNKGMLNIFSARSLYDSSQALERLTEQ